MVYVVTAIVLAVLGLIGLRWHASKRLRDFKSKLQLPGYLCRKGRYDGRPAFGWYQVTQTSMGISPTPHLVAVLRPNLVHPQISVIYTDAHTNERAVNAIRAARLSERRNLPWHIRVLFVRAYVFGCRVTIVEFDPTDEPPVTGQPRLKVVK
jgi:hypothetical protein